jgi:hypothetical protein
MAKKLDELKPLHVNFPARDINYLNDVKNIIYPTYSRISMGKIVHAATIVLKHKKINFKGISNEEELINAIESKV